MDIPATVQEFKAALESSGISQRFAAKFIMDSTSQGNLSFLLEKGKSKHWSELSCRGRLPYIRMRRWLDSPEEQRITLSQLSMTKGTTAIFNFCAYLSHIFFHFIFTLIVFFHFFLKYLLDLFVLVEYNFYVHVPLKLSLSSCFNISLISCSCLSHLISIPLMLTFSFFFLLKHSVFI